MLHELLFALSGYPGDVFVPHPPHPEQSFTFAIPSDFPLLHPTERNSLNRLGQLGWIYAQLKAFTTSVRSGKRTKDAPLQGAYIQVLITTLEHVLDDYRQDLLDLEKRILNKEDEAGGGVVPIALVISRLARWELLLPGLHIFVQKLQGEPQRYHGCRLFDLLMDEARSGIAELRHCMEDMIMHLHDVLYRQLTAWMVYGQWVDPDAEFFIVRCTNSKSTAGWQSHYALAKDRIPKHLPLSLAESILFVGKAVATVSQMDDTPIVEDEKESSNMARPSTLIKKRRKIPIPEEMKKIHLQLLLSLHSSQTKNNQRASPWIVYPQQLRQVVQKIRRSTADWLFSRVLIGDHGLRKYLVHFRQMFLLGYGDLATNLVDECAAWRYPEHARRKRNKVVKDFRHQELNALLAKASVATEMEDALEGYSLRIVKDNGGERNRFHFADLLISDVRCILTYDMHWPIDLFLSQDDLAHYIELWCFLIALKTVQVSLSKLWKILRGGSTQKLSGENNGDGYRERAVWRLRSHMLFWVDALWNHIQANVISDHYRQLLETIAPSFEGANGAKLKRRSFITKALDFEEMQAAHDTYLQHILRGCLLSSSNCAETVYDILHVCMNFCTFVEHIANDGVLQRNKRRKTVKTAADIVDEWTENMGKGNKQYGWMDQVTDLATVRTSDRTCWKHKMSDNTIDANGSNSLSEAERFLESLDLPDAQPSETGESTKPTGSTDPNDIMSFLDEISKYPAEEQRKEPQNVGSTEKPSAKEKASGNNSGDSGSNSGVGGWMSWGNSLWSQASAAVKTTTEQITSDSATRMLEDRVKHLQGLVNKEHIEKLGNELRNLTATILETVAPPISEHELVEVWLSHDMKGYGGMEALVYRAFARVMEHTESGQVVVRKIEEEKQTDETKHELNMCEGVVEGTKLAKANVDHLIKVNYTPPEPTTSYTPQSGPVPVINCPVFMAIQPVKSTIPRLDELDKDEDNQQLVFVILLIDPTHQLKFKTFSQSLPLAWLDIPYEENEWVEDKIADVIRAAVTTIAQDYVWTRMTGGKQATEAAVGLKNEESSK
ncbi:Gamma-tubulin complex component 4 [Apophysomyces ossiformis]|uniref:Gamma-tubulin complex component 4 n=1 Tax=Apophysomyces ossiformis TaxID=679940 RepID=A0A8H7BT11_9FUNG|nr:Gamma-tubulin complex component 4 [Apophysomyces ossiformis]